MMEKYCITFIHINNTYVNCHISLFIERKRIRTQLVAILLTSLFFPINGHAALQSVTTHYIQGTSPYLTFDNGVTKATDTSALLGIKLSNGMSYNQVNNTSSANNPIELPIVGQTIADVQMLIPTTTNSIELSTLLGGPYNYWRDDDGDGEGANAISATGSLMLTIQDSNGNILTRPATLNPCLADYYKVTLSNTAGTLKTQYGNPDTTIYDAKSVTYYVKPKISTPYVCYAQPNLAYSGSHSSTNQGETDWDGPSTQWNNTQGFFLQNIQDPIANFPTIGAYGLFFYLRIAGAPANSITYTREPSTSGIDLDISVMNNNVAKIMLTGPRNGASVQAADTAVPTTFIIKSGETAIYSFKITKWFIARPNDTTNGYDANYCQNTYGSHYRIPNTVEYSNANGHYWTGGLAGQPNHYQRRINGGLFSEWGSLCGSNGCSGLDISIYTSSDFDNAYYWASETYNTFHRFVYSDDGEVSFTEPINRPYRLACVK